MLRLLVFLAIAAALAVVGVYLANNPGNVVLEWQGYRLETSVGILILAVLAIGVALVLLVELLRWLLGLPRRVREHRRHAREVRGYQALTGGLVAAAAGDIEAARAMHRQANRLLPERGSVLMLAAQTAQLEGREDEAHLKFRQMLRSRETELLGLRGLLAQAVRTGDQAEALSLARRAYRRSPTAPWVLTTLFDLLTRAERWQEALSLTPELVEQKLITENDARRHRAVLHHMLAVGARDENRPHDALKQARRALRLIPPFVPSAVLASDLAMQLGKRRLATRLVEDTWRSNPHPDLARAYARLVEGETPEQRLDRVEKRLRPLRPDHPELHVAVGELAIAAGRPERAREALERALALEPTPRVYRLLAELERSSGADPARIQDLLAKAAEAQPDHAWVCEDTGEVLPEWRPFGASGRFDVVRWAVPPRVAALQGREYAGLLMGAAGTGTGAAGGQPQPSPERQDGPAAPTTGDRAGGEAPPVPSPAAAAAAAEGAVVIEDAPPRGGRRDDGVAAAVPAAAEPGRSKPPAEMAAAG
jgi:HemY protein